MGNNVRIGVGVPGASKAASDLDKLKDKVDKLRKNPTGVTAGVAAGLTVKGIGAVTTALGGMENAIEDSIKAASDLNEQTNKSAVVFGSAADSVEAFASTAATSFGESKREAIEAAGAFGNLFNTIGLGQSQSAEMSTTLVKLAADLASFHNIDPSDALQKLQAGLVGEARPMRELGVLLSEAQVSAEAAALGFKKVNGEFSEGAKVQARYSLILKQSKSAQGDFARTAGSMANQQRILSAESENLSAELGEKLIPVVISLQKALIDLFDVTSGNKGQLKGIGSGVADEIAHGSIADLQRARAAILTGLNNLGGVDDSEAGIANFLFGDQRKGLKRQLDIIDEALNGTYESMRETSRITRVTGGSVAADAGKMGDAFTELGDKADAGTGQVIQSSADMVKALDDDAQKLIDGYFDPIENKYDLRELKSATVARLEELHAAKTVKAREKAKRALTQALDDEGKKLEELASQGRATAKDQADYAKHIKQAYGKIPPEIQKFLDKIKLVNEAANATVSVTVKTGHTSKNPGRHQARGGLVAAGQAYTVGEEGEETFVPGQSGNIIPHGAGGDTIILNVHGRLDMSASELQRTVDRMRSVARRRAQ
jgi:hypothetical protein